MTIYIVILIFIISVLITMSVWRVTTKEKTLLMVVNKYKSIISWSIIVATGCIPFAIWIIWFGKSEFKVVVFLFVGSLLFSLIPALLFKFIENALIRKQTTLYKNDTAYNIKSIQTLIPLGHYWETEIEASTLERFGLSHGAEISFEIIDRLGNKFEFALLEQDIDALKATPA